MKIEFDATKNVEYNLEKQKKFLACFLIYCPGCASVSSVCVEMEHHLSHLNFIVK